MLELNKIYKTYNNNVEALKETYLSFNRNGLTFICGPSGSGKSTLLNIMAGFLTPSGGTITYDGNIIDKKNRNLYIHQKVAYIFQTFDLINSLNVKENILLGVNGNINEENENKLDEILNKLNISHLKNRKVRELSGGECQRVAIARALVKDPEIIFADEPTGQLDSKNSIDIFEILKEISKDKIVICVTHDKDKAYEYGDRVIELLDGNIVEDTNKENSKPTDIKPFIKNKNLNFQTVIRLGFSPLAIRITRLIIIIILASVSLTIIGVSHTALKFDGDRYAAKSTLLKEYDEIIVSALDDFNNGFTSEEIEELNKFTNKRFIQRYYYQAAGNKTLDFNIEKNNSNIDNSALAIYNELDFNYYNLKITYGTLPINDDEILISDYIVEEIKKSGFNDGNIINNQDILGKTIYIHSIYENKNIPVKVCGIFNLNQDMSSYVYINTTCFINKKCLEDKFLGLNEYTVATSTAISTMINDEDDLTSLIKYFKNITTSNKVFRIVNLQDMKNINENNNLFIKILMPIGIVFTIFSAMLIYSYINICLKNKQKEFGILKALGIKTNNIFAIYSINSIIITLFSSIISSIISYHFVSYFNDELLINYNLELNVLVFNYIEVIMIILVSLISSLLAIFVPIYLNSRKDIITTIKTSE